MEKITFTDPDTQEETEFFCLEQTQINNQNYILVTEEEDGDSEAYILRETSFGQGETVYEMVDLYPLLFLLCCCDRMANKNNLHSGEFVSAYSSRIWSHFVD